MNYYPVVPLILVVLNQNIYQSRKMVAFLKNHHVILSIIALVNVIKRMMMMRMMMRRRRMMKTMMKTTLAILTIEMILIALVKSTA